jgi:LPS-assembly lipoprotein
MLGLAACGYSPLYGTSSAGVQASEALQRVSIGPIDQGQGLVGRDVRVALMDRMNPNGEPGAPLQRLDITLTSSIGGLLVQPDSAITRYNYQLVGTFKLIDVATSKVLAQGTAVGTSAYNVVTNEYATVVARRDAERRAADSIGDQITLRVALYLKKNAS